jgi:hypothetical protein
VDSALELCNIKNIIVLSNKNAKNAYLSSVYPHNIDCIVLTKEEALDYKDKNCKFVFFGCFIKELADQEHIIMDDFIYKNGSPKPYTRRWEPESLATFITCWFGQGKIRSMGNNHSEQFINGKASDGRFEWLKDIMC